MFESETVCNKHGKQYSLDGRECDLCLLEWKEEMVRKMESEGVVDIEDDGVYF